MEERVPQVSKKNGQPVKHMSFRVYFTGIL